MIGIIYAKINVITTTMPSPITIPPIKPNVPISIIVKKIKNDGNRVFINAVKDLSDEKVKPEVNLLSHALQAI